MLRVLVGVFIGVYITQNYNVPDMTAMLKEIQNILIKYEKPPRGK